MRRRVVILGGGPAAIATAWALTDPDNPESQNLEVTLLTIGWRLGGKGACGRDANWRILEHGLHVWGGFYENAFRMMRDIYGALNRPPEAPLSTCFPDPANPSRSAAYTPVNHIVFGEVINGVRSNWEVDFSLYASSDRLPGTDNAIIKPIAYYVVEALDLITKQLEQLLDRIGAPACVRDIVEVVDVLLERLENAIAGEHLAEHPATNAASVFHFVHNPVSRLLTGDTTETAHQKRLAEALHIAKQQLWPCVDHFLDNDPELRHLWYFVDLAVTLVRGVLLDDVLNQGICVIEDKDFAAWMTQSGLSDYTREGVAVTGFYDYLFAYDSGDPDKPVLSAGTGLIHFLRLFFTYNQSIWFKVSSGMGDAVFAPAYEALRKRGVKFQFFSDVREIRPSQDRQRVDQIDIAVQMRLAAGVTEYQPFLTDPGGLSCWPSQPLLDQIDAQDAARYSAGQFDLEAPSPDWEPAQLLTLKHGVNFDEVVLAITLEPLQKIYAPLTGSDEAGERWTKILQPGQTVATVAAQVWLNGTWAELHRQIATAVSTHFPQMQSSWLDMSQVLDREGWGPGGPKALLYLCGYLPDDTRNWDLEKQKAANAAVRQNTLEWLESTAPYVLPAMGAGSAFRWDLVHDGSGAAGENRFNAQYWRANISPPERYVLTLPGGYRFRPYNGKSGFDHLWVAGDWCFTGMGGCVEGAVMAGLQAARAVCGYPSVIVGELDEEGRMIEVAVAAT